MNFEHKKSKQNPKTVDFMTRAMGIFMLGLSLNALRQLALFKPNYLALIDKFIYLLIGAILVSSLWLASQKIKEFSKHDTTTNSEALDKIRAAALRVAACGVFLSLFVWISTIN